MSNEANPSAAPKAPPHGPPTFKVTVTAPKEVEPKSFTWPQTKKVGDAAIEAAAAFGYEPGGTPTFQNDQDKVLDRDKPLVAAGVRDGDHLELVDVGVGV